MNPAEQESMETRNCNYNYTATRCALIADSFSLKGVGTFPSPIRALATAFAIDPPVPS